MCIRDRPRQLSEVQLLILLKASVMQVVVFSCREINFGHLFTADLNRSFFIFFVTITAFAQPISNWGSDEYRTLCSFASTEFAFHVFES